jgi:multidrug efflux pump subunit AcrA (membrane-fusion protein)
MFARVDFGDPKGGVILLPASAVVNVEEKNFVFLVKSPGIFRRREVILENTNSDQLIVASGLRDSDEVVTDGAMLLKGLSFGF